jgi:SAM-dependent MidA family methyltransferase
VTPASELLAAEIRNTGPLPFGRFMEVALYHPEHGYYRRARDPFGKEGDFYTAEQIQPVFGILVAARIRQLFREIGEPSGFTVVELGAGRQEMAPAFSAWPYLPIDVETGALPAHFPGVVFSNEFFDALPVDAAIYQDGGWRERRVDFAAGRFHWIAGGVAAPAAREYLRVYGPAPEEGRCCEIGLEALSWIERLARSLESGYVLTIDYGYTRAESPRFPAGTLMAYRRHTAREDVLQDPGQRDITAHVNFTALMEAGAALGLKTERFQTLAQFLLEAGEPDQFAAALGSAAEPGEGGELRRRMHLKTLLFGMGETFRVLLQRKAEPERAV